MITKEKKNEVMAANATHEGDTGSPEVQIAILSERSSIRMTTTAVSVCTRWSVSAAACSTMSQRRTSSVIVQSLQSWASADKMHQPQVQKPGL